MTKPDLYFNDDPDPPADLAEDAFPGHLAPGPEVLEETYPDYDDRNSRVISGPLHGAKFPGRGFPDWREARAVITTEMATKGRKLYKFWTTPGRWYARIAM